MDLGILSPTSILVIASLIIIIDISLIEGQELSPVYGQVQSNITSRVCNADGTCITTICINNEPCRTIKLNSTTGMTQDNSTGNEDKSNPLTVLPQQII